MIDEEDPLILIPELCRLFYKLGWVTGTGGGISIKSGERYYIAPSGVQKERMKADDLYILDGDQKIVRSPLNITLSPSQCTPLFFNAYDQRNAGACIHTHSQNAVILTMLCTDSEFRITHQEMIKGIRKGSSNENHNYYDTIIVPIIENTAEERDLKERMHDAIEKYPLSNAVLVRRHGVYVWGDSWQKAKSMTECYDYLFEIAIKMNAIGIKADEIPKDSDYL